MYYTIWLAFLLYYCMQAHAFNATIVPIGASIVWGQESTHGNGWRRDVWNALTNRGNNITMVGTQIHGDMNQPFNEGYPGKTIDQVKARIQTSFSELRAQPTVIVTLVGTNDLWPNSTSVAKAPDRFSNLLTYLQTLCSSCVIVASSLPPNNNTEMDKKINVYNAAITAEIRRRAGNGEKILFSDGNEGMNTKTDLSADGTHPNDVGYAIIGHRISEQIMLAGRNGWLGP